MIQCTRILEFDAGHRIINHESKCKYFHGHRYKIEVTFAIEELDSIGRVVDFGVIKSIFGKWIDDNLDHTMILHESDTKIGKILESETGQKVYYMKDNPTAENIAKHLMLDIMPDLNFDKNLKCIKLVVNETPNCSAEFVI